MTFNYERPTTARKAHRCAHCRGRIAPGETYLRVAGNDVYGDFMAFKAHTDCRALWHDMFDDWGDWNDGMDLDLAVVLSESGDLPAVREALNHHRGFFPHAVCRIEFRLRYWLTEDNDG